MFTFLGKVMVLLNVALSLLLAGLAFGLFATGIDWSDNPAKAGKPEGETLALRKQLQKELGQLGFKAVLSQAEAPQGAARAWGAARVELLGMEEARARLRPGYARRLQQLLTGPGPLPEVELVNHMPAPGPDGLPRTKRAQSNDADLLPRAKYFADIKGKRKESLDLDVALRKLYREDVRHTDRIVGDTDKPGAEKGTDPGLLELLDRDRLKREGLEVELRLIESQDVNTQIDAAAVRRSYGSVEERIKELEVYLAKRGVTFTRWEKKKGAAAKKD